MNHLRHQSDEQRDLRAEVARLLKQATDLRPLLPAEQQERLARMRTAMQRQGVPSKLMVYPDEGHWILKPQNSQLWYKSFFNWLATYLE